MATSRQVIGGSPGSANTSPSSSTEIKSRLKASYDAIAPRYNAWTEKAHPVRLRFLEKLLPRLSSTENASVLELGCGAGALTTKWLASLPNVHVTANDLSPNQIAIAREKLANQSVTLIAGDMMELSFAANQFDAVVAMYSMIHLPREEQATLIHRIGHWLKPGGKLLATFVPAEFETLTREGWLGEKEGKMFWSSLGTEKTVQAVEEAGLNIESQDVVNQDEGEGEEVVEHPFLWVFAEKSN